MPKRLSPKPIVTLVITDLDNTLFDWFAMWHASFSAMLAELVRESSVPEAVLLSEFKAVHRKYRTAEYAFAIEELPSLQAQLRESEDASNRYGRAIDAFREARRRTLRLYPGVEDTLRFLRRRGCLLVAYTESQAFYTQYRLRKLELDVLLDYVYSPPDHKLPAGKTPESIRHYPADRYRLRHTVAKHTPDHTYKPNPVLLRQIVSDVGASLDTTLYIGDSLPKDIAMAQCAPITDAWAKYGEVQNKAAYDLLRQVTHWSDEDVARERELHERTASDPVIPTHTLENGLADIRRLFSFRKHKHAR